MLCVAFSTALAGGLHALAADLHELQTTLALFFGDVPFGADAYCEWRTLGRAGNTNEIVCDCVDLFKRLAARR